MNFLSDYGLFLAETVTIVAAIMVVVGFVISAGMKGQHEDQGRIKVKRVNEKYDEMLDDVKAAVFEAPQLKAQEKQRKKEQKEKKKALKKSAKVKKSSKTTAEADLPAENAKRRIYVLDFIGDIKASATEELRQVITAVLAIARKEDEIVLRLESQGGMVHSYGLASSQLARITSKEIPLTVCVDKVAASGGYMMACVANKIVAAPFAILGSIGVVAQLPNFHKLLKKNNVDFEMLTAGEHKRTLTMFGENTDKGRKKFVEDLEDTHVLFKEFISEHRPTVNIGEVATGEIWFGLRAQAKNLVDAISTSDEYLFSNIENADLFEVSFEHKKSLAEKFGVSIETAMERVFSVWWQKLNNKIFS